MIWNMQSRLIAAGLVVLISCGANQTARAEALPSVAAGVGDDLGAVRRIIVAQDLLAASVAAKDPLLALSAARLMQSVGFSPSPGMTALESEGDVVARLQTLPAAFSGDRVEGAFQIARDLAQGDDLTMEWIDREEEQGRRAETVTAGYVAATLEPGGTDSWQVPLFGSSMAEIGLVSEAPEGLHLWVGEQPDAAVCLLPLVAGRGVCPVFPAENSLFTVVITNTGPEPIAYVLLTN